MRGAVVARLLGCLVAALLVMAPVHGPYPEPQPAAAPASAEHVTVDDSTRKDMDQAKNDIHELLLHMGEVQKTLKRLTDKRDNPPPVPSENNNSWLQMLILSSGQVAVVLIAIALWPIFRPRADPGVSDAPKILQACVDLAKRCDGIDSGLKELTAKVAVASAPTAIIDPKLSESVATIQRGVRDLQAAQPGREIGDFVSEFKQMRLLLDRIHRVVLEIHRVVLEQAPRSSPVAVAASLPAAGFLRPPAAEPAALPSPAPGHDLVRPPAAAASASVAPPEGMLTQYNALLGLLGDQSLLPDFKTRFQAIWVTHSRDGLVADDREPEKSAANDFLFVPAGRSTASASQRTGFLLPGLNFFRARSALTHPQTLQKIFGGIFRVQETAQDRLISPARVVQSGLTLDVREEGELEFAR